MSAGPAQGDEHGRHLLAIAAAVRQGRVDARVSGRSAADVPRNPLGDLLRQVPRVVAARCASSSNSLRDVRDPRLDARAVAEVRAPHVGRDRLLLRKLLAPIAVILLGDASRVILATARITCPAPICRGAQAQVAGRRARAGELQPGSREPSTCSVLDLLLGALDRQAGGGHQIGRRCRGPWSSMPISRRYVRGSR